MKRTIIRIDEEKCNDCGECIIACHEGALQIIDGKARLISEIYCDGLGDCLGECPTGAITLEERDSLPYDQDAVDLHLEKLKERAVSHGCPGSASRTLSTPEEPAAPSAFRPVSRLRQWPVQIKLMPTQAPYYEDAHLLIAADCTAFAYPTIHEDFMKNRVTLVGCPKLDSVDYKEKLEEIIRGNRVKSITVLRMSVPCCGGLVSSVTRALQDSGKMIPWSVVTVGPDGALLED